MATPLQKSSGLNSSLDRFRILDKETEVFILYNSQEEEQVQPIVEFLDSRGIKTYFWKRDIKLGEDWQEAEDKKAMEAKLILLFLGPKGWGPVHEPKAKEYRGRNRPILPVVIGAPKESDFLKAGEIFRRRRYFHLESITNNWLENLADEVQKILGGDLTYLVDNAINIGDFSWVNGLLEGSHRKKQKTLQRLFALSNEEKRDASEHIFELFKVNRDEIPNNASWIITALLRVALEDERTKNFVLQSFTKADKERKFWILANTWNWHNKASYLGELLSLAQKDSNSLITALAEALNFKEGFFDRILVSGEFEEERVNDLLRILTVTNGQRFRDHMDRYFFREGVDFWWLTTACLNQNLDSNFYDRISLEPGLEQIISRSLESIQTSQGKALDDSAEFLSMFEKERLLEGLKYAEFTIFDFPNWDRLKKKIEFNFKRRQREYQTQIQNDTAKTEADLLDVLPEVKILSAVMMTRDLKPPLAIGLFGNWGTGKSYFMHLMRDEIDALKDSGKPVYCSSVVQIEFNAWHYVEANLWASLMSTILEKLIGVVEPEVTVGEKKISLLKELDDSKKEKAEAEAEKQTLQAQYEKERKVLESLEQERLTGRLQLKEFSLLDIPTLLTSEQLKDFKDTFEELGINNVYRSVEDFEAKLDEVKSFSGRFWTLVQGIAKSKNWGWTLLFLLLGLVLIPWGWDALKSADWWPLFAKSVSTLTVQISTTLASVGGILVHFVRRYSEHLGKLEKANVKIQEEFQRIRAKPGMEEENLAEAVIKTEAHILEAESKISATEGRIEVIEKRIFEIENENGLAHFLKTRTGSGDYQKHLGLVSVIRKDFETLSRILLEENTSSALKKVDRIVLYVDDLDRCPEKTVIEVLQAVHLLLAYPLFVVVVGVDSRWLMHSLKKGFGAFASFEKENEDKLDDLDEWKTTPQNFLEKIFQIPFHLKSMGDKGFRSMIQTLMGAKVYPNPTPPLGFQARPTSQSPLVNLPFDVTNGVDVSPEVGNGRPLDEDDEDEELPEITQEALRITEWETEFASKLHVFIRTPRTAKRFSNIYRLIKASVPPRELPEFEGTFQAPGEFQVPMLLLSVITGSPEFCQFLIPKLQSHGFDVATSKPSSVQTEFEKEGFSEEWAHWKEVTRTGGFLFVRRLFPKWFPKVARFSFEVGKMELSPNSINNPL